MPAVATLSNHYYAELLKGNIDLINNAIKLILMDTTFVFDQDTHATLADVTADQLVTGNGYTQNNKTLTGKAVVEDDANNRGQFTCDDITFVAAGGDIGPTGAAILYDDTSDDDTVIGCIDFGADYTVNDGKSMKIASIVINNSL